MFVGVIVFMFVIMFVIMIVFVVTQKFVVLDGQVDLVPVLVDHRCVLDEELERFSACDIRAYRLQRATPLELASHLCGFLFGPRGQLLDFGVDLFVGRGDALLRNH
ncbi:MAG: hypothetical protein QOH28_3843 [Actinomycetota bacterium]|nr:hypothetical protein [Actinomycetota bacterium]